MVMVLFFDSSTGSNDALPAATIALRLPGGEGRRSEPQQAVLDADGQFVWLDLVLGWEHCAQLRFNRHVRWLVHPTS